MEKYKMIKKGLLILLCLPLFGFAQSWEKNIDFVGFFMPESVEETTDGGYIIGGSYADNVLNIEHLFIIKTDSNGDTLWTNTYMEGRMGGVKETVDGGYIATGMGGGKIIILKINITGDTLWTNTWNGGGTSIQQTIDEGYIICGGVNNSVGLFKTNSLGDSLWGKTYGGPNTHIGAISVEQTSDSGYVFCGNYWQNNGGTSKIVLIKTNSLGDSLWGKIYDYGGGHLDAYSVQQTLDGGYIVSGIKADTSMPITGGGGLDIWDAYLIKTNSQGDTIWTNTYNPNDSTSSFAYSAQQTLDGGYIFCGNAVGIYLVKTNANGVEQWHQTYHQNVGCGSTSVQQTSDGGYIIAGLCFNGFDSTLCILIKTDGNGAVTSAFNMSINPNRRLQKVVDMLGKETPYRRNTPLLYIYDDGTVEKRIIIE